MVTEKPSDGPHNYPCKYRTFSSATGMCTLASWSISCSCVSLLNSISWQNGCAQFRAASPQESNEDIRWNHQCCHNRSAEELHCSHGKVFNLGYFSVPEFLGLSPGDQTQTSPPYHALWSQTSSVCQESCKNKHTNVYPEMRETALSNGPSSSRQRKSDPNSVIPIIASTISLQSETARAGRADAFVLVEVFLTPWYKWETGRVGRLSSCAF